MHPERIDFMGRAQEHLAIHDSGDQVNLHLTFPGDQGAVRGALKRAMSFLRGLNITSEQAGSVELVLAEVINNVIEHAYAGQMNGVIELRIAHLDDLVSFSVADEGIPIPGGEAPEGLPHDLDCTQAAMPEGGFGWFLIRELTHDLSYRHDGIRNRLSFGIKLGQDHLPN